MHGWRRAGALGLVAALLGCGDESTMGETFAEPDTEVFTIQVSEPAWVIPSASVPDEVAVQPSNNNVDIVTHGDALFLAWRTGPTHFADEAVQMPILRSDDGGDTWELESVVDLDADLREPRFLSMDGMLQLIFFEAGVFAFTFDPQRVWRTVRGPDGVWGVPEVLFDAPEVPWDIKVRDGVAWMTSYIGEHYGGEDASIDVIFRRSDDGHTWSLVDGADHVYRGGVSETAIEFDTQGGLWVVTRNEDGDATGYGSHVCYASPGALGVWDCPSVCSPDRYDSPELFRHQDEIYLVARRDIGGPYGPEGDL
ncbi:MAG: sialidase family protein, partial [Myxococcota bacterium]|nr:sialidase family protein [Myxococcota bacterium]